MHGFPVQSQDLRRLINSAQSPNRLDCCFQHHPKAGKQMANYLRQRKNWGDKVGNKVGLYGGNT